MNSKSSAEPYAVRPGHAFWSLIYSFSFSDNAQYDADIENQLKLKSLKTMDYYSKFFKSQNGEAAILKLDRISDVLEPEVIILFLKTRNVCEYDNLIAEVEGYLKNKSMYLCFLIIIF